MELTELSEKGWVTYPFDPELFEWAQQARQVAVACIADPALRAAWLQCEGTWFVGVDVLPNPPNGSISGVALKGQVIRDLSVMPPLHRGQVSVTYPGYPRPRDGESKAAFRYRLNRDAAHVDGVLAEGHQRKRYVREPHAFILGLPLTTSDPEASPLVVWEGSHIVMGAAFRQAFYADTVQDGKDVDVTEIYQAARRVCFEQCRRVALPSAPGEALLLHRHLLHGIAPWAETARADDEGRMMAYFRPELTTGLDGWLSQDLLPHLK